MQFAALSNRPAAMLERAFEASLYPANLATLLVPDIFGSHRFPPWGPNYETVPEVASVDESFNYLFVGSVPVILLMWLGIAGGGLMRRGRILMTAVLAAALLYMLGRYTPFFALGVSLGAGRRPVPPADRRQLRVRGGAGDPGRASAVGLCADRTAATRAGVLAALLAALMLAVIGCGDRILGAHRPRRRRALAALWIAPIPVLVIFALLKAQDAASRRLVAARRSSRSRSPNCCGGTSPPSQRGRPSSLCRARAAATAADIEALELLERSIRERQRDGERPRVEIMGIGGAWQNLAMVRGLEATNGYNPLRIGFYDRLVAPGETT